MEKQKPKKYQLFVQLKGLKPSLLTTNFKDLKEAKKEINRIKNTKGKYVDMNNGFLLKSEIIAVFYKEGS